MNAKRRQPNKLKIMPPLEEQWPDDDPAAPGESPLQPTFEEPDDEALLELDEDYWDALIPDDDYEPQPDRNDFWTEQDAA